MASIVSRQAVALWPLLSTGRQQRYGPYCLQAAAALWPLLSPGGSNAMAPIVYRQAAVVQGLIVSQK